MEIKVKGILLSSADYGDKDKLVLLFTLEKGLLTAKIRSVKNQTAKLKILKETFCFADYILNENNGIYTIINGDVIDNFYDLTQDIDKYYSACEIVSVVKKVASNQPMQLLFLNLLKSLKFLTYENVNPNYILSKFYITVFSLIGYDFSLNKCSVCGSNFLVKIYFNNEYGEIVCSDCRRQNSKEISQLAYSSMRILSFTEYEKLKSIKLKDNAIEEMLQLFRDNLKNRIS